MKHSSTISLLSLGLLAHLLGCGTPAATSGSSSSTGGTGGATTSSTSSTGGGGNDPCFNKADGSPCDDSDACTQTDSCQAGTCAGANAVTCAAPDPCHAAGSCNPATGTCSNPEKGDGVACDDGDACTQTDTCQAGVCTGENLVICDGGGSCVAGACVVLPCGGAAGFGAPVALVGDSPRAVVAADLNGDSKLDLAVANSGSNTVSVLLNTCLP